MTRAVTDAGDFATLRVETHHNPAPTIRQHGLALHQNGRGTPTESLPFRTGLIATNDDQSPSLLIGHPLMALQV